MKRKILKKLHPLLRRLYACYLSKPRKYSYQSIRIVVNPGVFHPGLFYSTKVLLQFLETYDLAGKDVLELGCGSGLLSIYVAKRGGLATASDINAGALENTLENARQNQVTIDVVGSDLFENLDPWSFDTIIINPPYYPSTPSSDAEKAWFCGEGFEYFARLFQQLSYEPRNETEVFMILSEDCDIKKIQHLAEDFGFVFNNVFERNPGGEINYVFRVRKLTQ